MPFANSVIAGFAESKIVRRSEKDVFTLAGEMMNDLLVSTGFEKDEIDGLILTPSLTAANTTFWVQTVAEYLGLELTFADTTDLGGCGAMGSVMRAAMAIEAGLCSTVLLINADTPTVEYRFDYYDFHEEWTDPYGLMGPPGAFGLLSKRYEHLYGLDYEALGKLAITQRNHALLNDNACEQLRKPLTLDEYMNSRMIAEPIRLLDCVMPADGANGVIMTRRDLAKGKGLDRFLTIRGYGEMTNLGGSKSIVDPTETGHRIAGAKAFAQAGLTPQEIGSFHPYDDFIIAIMLQLEMLGFCEKGQGCAYVRDTDFGFDGDLPLNTGGGQISAGQAGFAGGGTNLVEGVRQLFGKGGKRQVRNADNALFTGIGWIPYGRNWGSSLAMILQAES